MRTITYDETKFRLVPVEPTEAMLKAAWKCTLGGSLLMAERAYRAAVAAAPAPGDAALRATSETSSVEGEA